MDDNFPNNQATPIHLVMQDTIDEKQYEFIPTSFDDYIGQHQLKEKYYLRYTDDFVILSRDQERLKNLIPQINLFLANNLKLTLHPTKVLVKTFSSGIDFLGWVHFFNHRVLRTVTKKRMFTKIKEQPIPTIINSYLGLLKHGHAFKLQERIRKLKNVDASP